MHVRFWGVRGTVPTPGPGTVKYGGNTPCLDVLTSNQQIIIIGAGTGIRLLGETLKQEYPHQIEAQILLSHTHWDHIQGLPFFKPLQSRRNRFKLFGQKRTNRHLKEIVSGQFQEPYMPFAFRSLAAALEIVEVSGGETITLDEQTTVQTIALNHPGGCLGFRIQDHETALVYFTDTGWFPDRYSDSILRFVSGADLLIHDAFFLRPEEAQEYMDWGHSSWQDAVNLVQDSDISALCLFHYAPEATDSALESVLDKARRVFPRTFLAREGMSLQLPLEDELPI